MVTWVSDQSMYQRFFTGGRSGADLYLEHVFDGQYPGHVLLAVAGGQVIAIGE